MWPKLFKRPSYLRDETSSGRKRLLLRAALATVVLAGLAFGLRPAYRACAAWRARQLAGQAEVYLARSEVADAVRTARAAYLLRASEPAALRAVARVQTTLGQPNAVQFWKALLNLGKATDADRREYIDLCIRSGYLEQAQVELRQLTNAAPHHPSNLWLLSQLSLARREFDQSLQFVSEALAKEPGNQRYRLLKSMLQFDAPDPATGQAARQSVWEIARDQSAAGLSALTFLDQRTDLTSDQIRHLSDLLEKHTSSKTGHRLRALDLKIGLEPQRKAELLDHATAQYRDGPVADLAQYAAWLNSRREFTQTLAVLPLQRALNERQLFLLHLNALSGLERWVDMQEILKQSELPLPSGILEAFRARTAAKLNQGEEAVSHWRRALQAAEGDPQELSVVAQVAEETGEFQNATRAYRALIRASPNSLPVYRTLARVVRQHGTTEDLRDVVQEMVAKWPKDGALRNDLAYLKLLLREQVPQMLSTAQQLAGQFPEQLPIRCTVALGHLRSQNPTAGLAVLTNRPPYDWNRVLPSQRVVYVAALTANGKTQEAVQLLRGLPLESLRKEERALIQPELIGGN